MPHAELAGDLADVDCPTSVRKRAVARDDEEPADPGQCRDDVLGDTISKVLLFVIAAEVGKRQHGQRRLVGNRQNAGGTKDVQKLMNLTVASSTGLSDVHLQIRIGRSITWPLHCRHR